MYHCNTVDENDKLMNDCGTEDYTGVAKTTNLINNTTTSTEKIENFNLYLFFKFFTNYKGNYLEVNFSQ